MRSIQGSQAHHGAGFGKVARNIGRERDPFSCIAISRAIFTRIEIAPVIHRPYSPRCY